MVIKDENMNKIITDLKQKRKLADQKLTKRLGKQKEDDKKVGEGQNGVEELFGKKKIHLKV